MRLIPPPVCSRHVIGQMLPDVVFGALAQAVPERVPAEGAACLWNVTMRGETDRGANQAGGALFAVTAVCNRRHRRAAGQGRALRDRVSERSAGHAGGDQRIGCPVVFWRKELRSDSGGHGRHRGGLGQVIEIESAIGRDFELLAAFDRVTHPRAGVTAAAAGTAAGFGSPRARS